MSKRSNDFQELVALIERLSASPSARVTDSTELVEYPDSSLREIDVLIEDEVSGYPVRLAIECRDYKRRQDKTWIDELIGKYRDLPLDMIIAVSSSGFTKGALEKAKAVGIRALTVREALEEDWTRAFAKPRVKFSGNEAALVGVRLQFVAGEPDLPAGTEFTDWRVEGLNGEEPETVRDTALRLFQAESKEFVEEFVNQENLRDFSKPVDREFRIDAPYAAQNRFLVLPDGTRRGIELFVLQVAAAVRFVDANHRDFVYERKLATIASYESPRFGTHNMTLVQMSGDPTRTIRYAYRGKPPGAREAASPKSRHKTNRKKGRSGQPKKG